MSKDILRRVGVIVGVGVLGFLLAGCPPRDQGGADSYGQMWDRSPKPEPSKTKPVQRKPRHIPGVQRAGDKCDVPGDWSVDAKGNDLICQEKPVWPNRWELG